MKNVYSAVRTGSLNRAVCGSSLNGQNYARIGVSSGQQTLRGKCEMSFMLLVMDIHAQLLYKLIIPTCIRKFSRYKFPLSVRRQPLLNVPAIMYSHLYRAQICVEGTYG